MSPKTSRASRDELPLVYYKFSVSSGTHMRHQQQARRSPRQGSRTAGGYQYCWSKVEFQHVWRECMQNAIDVRTDAAVVTYPSRAGGMHLSLKRGHIPCLTHTILTII
jgi:hypothetical protein